MLKILFGVIISFFFFYMLYFVIIAMGVIAKKKEKVVISNKVNKFAILIAARNEEKVIENLIISLKKQNYPLDKYEIFVVVNNCVDNTKKVSLKHGVNVIECDAVVKSKGDVLRYTFGKLKKRNDIDAYAIFDADNVVHGDFLEEMNKMINKGYSVVQGFRETKNIYDNWLSCSYALLYYMQDLFVNKARYNLGKSSFLNGTGFIIKKGFIDKYGFNPVTLTEDIELTAICALNDEMIGFSEKAITYDEQVSSFKLSLTQRKRWSFGTMQCILKYFKKLFKKGITDGSFECFDVILFYFSIIFQVLIFFLSFLSFIYYMIILREFSVCFFAFSLVCYFSGVIFRIGILKFLNKSIRKSFWGVMLFDLFLISFVYVSFVCLFKKSVSWDVIDHKRNVSVDEVDM